MKHVASLLPAVCLSITGAMPALAYQLQVQPAEGDQVLSLAHNSLELVNASYVAWGRDWAWSGGSASFRDADPGKLAAFELQMRRIGVEGEGTIERHSEGSIRWVYNLEYTRDQTGIIGGGIQFDLELQSEGRMGHRADPVLLENNTGFTWEVSPGRTFEVRFEEPIARVYFERGNRNTIRAMFVPTDLEAGTSDTVTMTVILPEGGEVARSLAERYGPANTEAWFEDALHPHLPYIDLSAMNNPHKPAGRHGFLRREGERLVFEDGTVARFWGCNVQAYSLFIEDKDLIEQHARRIAALGYNLVRLHHHDSATWVRECLIAPGPTTQQINEQALDSYFYWIHCLKQEGIHLWVDLHVGRPWREGDAIPGWDDIADKARNERGASTKGFFYYNERMTELMRTFYRELLTRENPYTGKALKDEPAVAFMLLVNENDLTNHFGNTFLPDKNNPWHHAKFWEATEAWAAEHDMPLAEVRRTWLPGASKVYLNHRQHEWAEAMITFLRGELGVQVPIATDQMWGGNPLFSLPALTGGDLIDVHIYDGGEWLGDNPRFKGSFFHYIAASQVADYPLSVTEFNFADGASGRDPWSIPLMVAAQSAFQGWDAPQLYGYSQDALRGRSTSMWSSYNHPGVVGMSPAAALMYRRGDISGAETTAYLSLDADTLFNTDSHPYNFAAIRTLAEQHRIVIGLPEHEALPWLEPGTQPEGARLIGPGQLDEDFIPEGQNFVQSDTGELRRDWAKGVVTVDTARSQGAMGWLGRERTELADVIVEAETPKCAVFVTSLDGMGIAQSERLLISTAARVQQKRDGYLSEPVAARLTIRNASSGLRLVPLLGDGTKGEAVQTTRRGDFYLIDLPTDAGTHWFELTR